MRDACTERLAGQRPPLSCRTSPPQGGRLAVIDRFANLQRCEIRSEGATADAANLPPWGEMSGRTEGGDVERDLAATIRSVADMPHTPVSDRNRKNAKSMRRVMTDAELKLWNELRAHRLMGLGFRRQVPIAGYIVDFACSAKKLDRRSRWLASMPRTRMPPKRMRRARVSRTGRLDHPALLERRRPARYRQCLPAYRDRRRPDGR